MSGPTAKEAQLLNLEEALSHPQMIGVKLAHTHQHFRMDDADYYAIYEKAGAANAPVYLHTGPSPFPGTNSREPYINPLYMEQAFALYPQTQFILGHMCFDFINKSTDVMDRCFGLARSTTMCIWSRVRLVPTLLIQLVKSCNSYMKKFLNTVSSTRSFMEAMDLRVRDLSLAM